MIFIKPSNWNKIIQRKGVKLIDTRNTYEINIGQFKGAINPKTTSFREFPNKLKNIGIKKSNINVYIDTKKYYIFVKIAKKIQSQKEFLKKLLEVM